MANPLAKWAAIGLAILVALLWGYGVGFKHGFNDRTAHYEPILKTYAVRANQAEAEYRKIERESAAHVAAVADRYSQEKTSAIEERDSTIRALGRELRVRERFTCPGSGGVPKAASAASGDHGADERGLSQSDATFLVRFAARCDECARRLTACQGIVRR